MSADDLNIIRIRIPDSRPDRVRKMCSYAYTLKCELLKGDFVHLLQAWKLSGEDVENLLSVMRRYPRYAINEQQMKWLNEYQDSLCNAPDASVLTNGEFSDKLLKLFHNNEYLIEQLRGLSDGSIADKIRKWKNEKDKFGKPLIENPDNQLKSEYARELKSNGLIKCSEKNFRNKL